MWPHIISYNIISYHIMSCQVISYHVMSCHVMSCHVMSCHVMSCHIISYNVMSCHVMSCHVMSCHVISYHIISYHLISADEMRFMTFIARGPGVGLIRIKQPNMVNHYLTKHLRRQNHGTFICSTTISTCISANRDLAEKSRQPLVIRIYELWDTNHRVET